VRADHQGRLAVFEVDLGDPALPRKLLSSDASQDIHGDLLHDPKTGAAIGIGARAAHASGSRTRRTCCRPSTGPCRSGTTECCSSAPTAHAAARPAAARRAADGADAGGRPDRAHTVFDPLVLFLADPGHAVLQVSARGTLGLGAAHRDAGLKRWGQEAVDDLADALSWLVERGTADPARVCIVGGGDGGCAALMSAARAPHNYRCVVSFAGVSDLFELGERQRQFVHGRAGFERTVGSLWDDRAQLEAHSPRRLAQRIEAPVLLVPVTQSEGMADALKRAGKAHRFIRQEDGDHHLSHQAHRTQFFRELEAFLDAHIGPAAPAR
jgi:dienelactone hydrolase